MKVAGFFSGIGGFELGFERAGFEVVSVCEIEPFCNKVLTKHWPKVPNLGDIRHLSEASLAKICPSQASKRAERALEAGYIASILPLSVRKDLRGLSLKMSATLGANGCLTCGAHCTGSGMPACRYKCEPLTWERLTSESEFILLPTLTASSYGSCRGGGSGRVGKWRMSLQTMARKGLLPTLTRKGNYNRKGSSAKSGDGLATVVGGPLNPTWAEWYMGFPLQWTELEPSEMRSFRKSRKSSRKASCK